jgi:uncharacterized membrane protein YkvA (DUF1232 family)
VRPHAVWRFLSDRRASLGAKAFFVAAIAYAIMPIDFIPDVPLIGWIDDAGILSAAVAWAMNRVSKYDREHPEREEVK